MKELREGEQITIPLELPAGFGIPAGLEEVVEVSCKNVVQAHIDYQVIGFQVVIEGLGLRFGRPTHRNYGRTPKSLPAHHDLVRAVFQTCGPVRLDLITQGVKEGVAATLRDLAELDRPHRNSRDPVNDPDYRSREEEK